MNTLGVDPGLSGGIALITDDGRVEAWKAPATELDTLDLVRGAKTAAGGRLRAFLEHVGPMPGQGRVSIWKFAGSYFGLRMALLAAEVPFETVAPGKWQRALGCLSGGDKNVTKRKAQELFPTLKVGHATADALLIAEYGRRQA